MYTKGPWVVENDVNISAGRRGVATSGVYSDNRDIEKCHEENRDNARLIAAAPELLDALRKCSLVLSGYEVSKSMLIDSLESARAALAKAEGK